MTTTELIALLKANERGGATGRSREITLYINGLHRVADIKVTVAGTGDGVFTDIDLDIKGRENSCWIDVEERLPDYDEIVLVLNDDGLMHTAMRKKDGINLHEWEIMYSPYDNDCWEPDEHGEITHWMPLPPGPLV